MLSGKGKAVFEAVLITSGGVKDGRKMGNCLYGRRVVEMLGQSDEGED